MGVEEGVVGVGEDVDEGVADPDHLVASRPRDGEAASSTSIHAICTLGAGRRCRATDRPRSNGGVVADLVHTIGLMSDPYRLRKAVIPRRYEVELTPDLARRRSPGPF